MLPSDARAEGPALLDADTDGEDAMKRDLVIAMVIAGWLSLVLLLMALVDAPQRCENNLALVGFGVALLLGGGALARVYAVTYRHSPLTERLGRAALIALGAVGLLLGLVGAISQC